MIKKNKDTLFIDMKYIILYRKLGYEEIDADVFIYNYPQCTITIYSEEQRYVYQNESYPLLQYKDFVILECIDRLLKKGYAPQCVLRNHLGYDLAITLDETRLYCGIFAEGWGANYEELLKNYSKGGHSLECLYTSQLSGGLVDFKSEIHCENGVFQNGIFEKNSALYNESFYSLTGNKTSYPTEFVVKNDELIKYMGSNEIVHVPSGINRIGTGAFWNNLIIKEVILPDTVSCICGDAFVYCENLKKINIPQTVSEMGDDPFAGCIDIEIKNESPDFKNEDGVLFDKNKKFLIHYTASKKNEEYVIPESVTWIGKHSFYKCTNLRSVTISKNVKFMGNNAFSDCRNIHLVNESPYFHYIDGVLYDKNITTCMHYSMGSGIKVVNLEKTVRTIGRNCFWNCDMIEKIVIPESVRQIGYNPFANCKNTHIENHSPFYTVIEGILYDASVREMIYCPPIVAKKGEICIPDTVINIGRSAFTGCVSLKKVVLPKGLKFISRNAFSGCTQLEEILIPQTVEEIADWCFSGCTSLKKAYIPKHIKILPNVFKYSKAEIIRI